MHVYVQLHVQFDVLDGGMPEGVQFCQLVTVSKCEVSQPPANQVLSTVNPQIFYDISLTLPDCPHPAPPSLNGIRCNDSANEVLTTKEKYFPFWGCFILKNNFCLEVSCLIL